MKRHLTAAQRRALGVAASRPDGRYFPLLDYEGPGRAAVFRSLVAHGYLTDTIGPQITPAGRAALES